MDNKKLIKKITIDTEYGVITSNTDDIKNIEIKLKENSLNLVEINYIKELTDEIIEFIETTNELNKTMKTLINFENKKEKVIENEEDPEVIETITSNIKTTKELKKEIEDKDKKSKLTLTDNQKEILTIINRLHLKNGRCNVHKATILKQAEKKSLDMMSFSTDLYKLVVNGDVIKVDGDKYRPIKKI